MQFDSVIKSRRSIRKFQAKEVEQHKITSLLESARLCQSAKNRQPWKFMVLTGDKKNRVSEIMLSLFEKNDIELPGYVNSSKNSAKIINSAPVLILVFKEKDEVWNTGDLLSIGAAIEHICLKAVDIDLGALWIRDTVYTENEICMFVEKPELELLSAIAIGYPDEAPPPRPRKPINEILLQH